MRISVNESQSVLLHATRCVWSRRRCSATAVTRSSLRDAADVGSEAGALLRNCGTTARPWTIATARRGQRINVTVVDLARAPHATDPSAAATAAAASTSASDDRCRRYALFTEPEAVSSRYRCDEDARRRLSSLGETILYASQTGRVQMVLSSQSTASDKFLLIFTGMEIIRIHPGGPKSRQPRVDAVN